MGQTKLVRVLQLTTGETDWDRVGRLGVAPDLELTQAGRSQTQQMVTAQGGGIWLSSIICGSDEASRQTAEILARTAEAGLTIRTDPQLDELNFGLWHGLLEQELAEKFPTTYAQWIEDPWGVSIPGGEDLATCQARVTEAVRKAIFKTKRDSGALGIVLRPYAATLLRLAMSSEGEMVPFWEARKLAVQPLWVSLGNQYSWRVRELV